MTLAERRDRDARRSHENAAASLRRCADLNQGEKRRAYLILAAFCAGLARGLAPIERHERTMIRRAAQCVGLEDRDWLWP
jgi:hypothetical protein